MKIEYIFYGLGTLFILIAVIYVAWANLLLLSEEVTVFILFLLVIIFFFIGRILQGRDIQCTS